MTLSDTQRSELIGTSKAFREGLKEILNEREWGPFEAMDLVRSIMTVESMESLLEEGTKEPEPLTLMSMAELADAISEDTDTERDWMINYSRTYRDIGRTLLNEGNSGSAGDERVWGSPELTLDTGDGFRYHLLSSSQYPLAGVRCVYFR